MIPKAAEVRLTPEDRAVLEARVRAATTEQRDVFRARIILLAAEGRSTRSIARTVGTMPRTVSLWRGRFSREGLSGLADKPRPGSVPKYDAETGKYITQSLPCPFLDGNLCSIYEVRPAVCADYPHLHRNFRSRLWQVIDNAETCPIVYNVVERLKKTLGFVES